MTSQYLIDMDSVQIGNLPCPVGTEDFTDPALWGKDFSGFVRTLSDEDYSISMLVFSVLFCGLHPYATRNGAETLREEILSHNFPYDLNNADTEHIPLGGYDHIWEYLPEYLRKMSLLDPHVSDISRDELKAKQEAVAELCSKPDVLMDYQATARCGRMTKDPKALLDFSVTGSKTKTASNVAGIFGCVIWIAVPLAYIFFPDYAPASISCISMN